MPDKNTWSGAIGNDFFLEAILKEENSRHKSAWAWEQILKKQKRLSRTMPSSGTSCQLKIPRKNNSLDSPNMSFVMNPLAKLPSQWYASQVRASSATTGVAGRELRSALGSSAQSKGARINAGLDASQTKTPAASMRKSKSSPELQTGQQIIAKLPKVKS